MSFTLAIADIVFSVRGWGPDEGPGLRPSVAAFLADGPADLSIDVRFGPLPSPLPRPEECVFSTGSPWSLYRRGGEHVFLLESPRAGPEPFAVATFDDDFRRGEVVGRFDETASAPGGLLPGSLEFPLSEVLMVCLLAKGRGLMVHASGVDDAGRGLLFCGNSTHGKTTMARLWADSARVLNDDRVVLRRRGDRVFMFGTPWHGDLSAVSPCGVPLDRLHFLKQAPANDLRPVSGIEAASMLLARSFPPFWDPAGMEYTLDLAVGITRDVPCAELGFVPDPSAVEFVRCARSS